MDLSPYLHCLRGVGAVDDDRAGAGSGGEQLSGSSDSEEVLQIFELILLSELSNIFVPLSNDTMTSVLPYR